MGQPAGEAGGTLPGLDVVRGVALERGWFLGRGRFAVPMAPSRERWAFSSLRGASAFSSEMRSCLRPLQPINTDGIISHACIHQSQGVRGMRVGGLRRCLVPPELVRVAADRVRAWPSNIALKTE